LKIALIATRKVPNAKMFLVPNCTEIFTNIKGFTHEKIPVTYDTDLDLLIKNSDFVIALCFRKVKSARRFYPNAIITKNHTPSTLLIDRKYRTIPCIPNSNVL
jgi:hypothetical protein